MLDDDELQRNSNVSMVLYEDKFISHKNNCERIYKLGHIQMCHVCEESFPVNVFVTSEDIMMYIIILCCCTPIGDAFTSFWDVIIVYRP